MYVRWAWEAQPPNLCTSSSVLPDAYAMVAAVLRIACSVYGVVIPIWSCFCFQIRAMYGAVMVPPLGGNMSSGSVGWSICQQLCVCCDGAQHRSGAWSQSDGSVLGVHLHVFRPLLFHFQCSPVDGDICSGGVTFVVERIR